MKIVVLDAYSLGEDLSLSPLAALGELTVYHNTSPEELSERIADADVTVQNKVRLTREALASAKHLRLICEAATGYDNIDLDAARELGIAVCNVPGYSTPSVVQLTLSLVLSLATHLPEYTAHVADGSYSRGDAANRLVPVYHELCGKTWGIIGYGGIGRGVADVARALGCDVIYTRSTPDGDPACVTPDELYRRADVITVHTPLTPETRGMIDTRALSLMKDGVILVNVARGAVTDEVAIAEAVTSGKLGGFGCDVYSTEPFREDHPFFSLLGHPRVALTPHMAWGSFEARTRCLATMVSNTKAFLRGERQNRVV